MSFKVELILPTLEEIYGDSAPMPVQVNFTSERKGIRVPQDATLEEAASIAADHFLLFAPKDWPDLHNKAKRAGFMLVPSARIHEAQGRGKDGGR